MEEKIENRKKENKKVRESNIELLRIIAMVMIILFHMTQYLNPYRTGTIQNQVLGTILTSMGMIGVNIFVLITGYFNIVKNIRFKKIFKLWLQVLFYSIIMMLICKILNLRDISNYSMIKTFIPISYGNYWFASAYFMLYLAIPIINEIAKKINKKTYEKLLIILTFFFSIAYTYLYKSYYTVNIQGLSAFSWLVYLYLVSGYIKLYGIKFLENKKIVLSSIISIAVIYIGLLLFVNLKVDSDKIWYFMNMNSFFVLSLAILIFSLFKNIKIKSNKVINYLGGLTFAAYLIHENDLINRSFWAWIYNLLSKITRIDYITTILVVIISIPLIFISAMIFEFVRKKLEKLIFRNKKLNEFIEKADKKLL